MNVHKQVERLFEFEPHNILRKFLHLINKNQPQHSYKVYSFKMISLYLIYSTVPNKRGGPNSRGGEKNLKNSISGGLRK